MERALVMWIVVTMFGCAAVPVEKVQMENATSASMWSRRATELLARGDYLSASYYLEAELQRTGNESEVLPILIEAQIRADLLHAAMHNLRRLSELSPGNPQIEELFSLLVEVTGVYMSLSSKEVRS